MDKCFKDVSNQISEHESKTFYIIKAIAMLSVIAAHVNSFVDDMGFIVSTVTNFWSAFANVGVVAFFISSGFFFTPKIGGVDNSFWKKKLTTLFIPWFIFGTATYILSVLINKRISIIEYLKWILGSGTWYYYMTMLVLMYVIFKFIDVKEILLYLCIFINIISIIICTFNKDFITLPFLTNYLNVFNWIGFFAIGILMRKYRFDKIILRSKLSFYLCSILFIADCFILEKLQTYTYFHIFSFQYELTFFVILLYLGNWLSKYKCNKILLFIGYNTFFIYLSHMQIVQFIINKLSANIFKFIFAPFLGLTIMTIITFVIRFIAIKFGCGKLLKFIGIKK